MFPSLKKVVVEIGNFIVRGGKSCFTFWEIEIRLSERFKQNYQYLHMALCTKLLLLICTLIFDYKILGRREVNAPSPIPLPPKMKPRIGLLCHFNITTFSEFLEAVVSGDLNLKHIVGDDVGGQSAQALTATATHPNQ